VRRGGRARSRAFFGRLVRQALADLPAPFRAALENLAVVVEEEPQPADYALAGLPPGSVLFGIYRGVSLPQRDGAYNLVAPDTIAIFRRPLLAACRNARELAAEVRRTVRHEIGHYFGLDEQALAVLEE